MKRIALLTMVLLAAMGFTVSAQAHNVITYTDYESWWWAVEPISHVVTENFNDTTYVKGFSIIEVGGAGTVGYGYYMNYVDINANRYQIFNYAPGMWGFGGWFYAGSPNQLGKPMELWINDDNTYVLTIPCDADGWFFGFVADNPFFGVRILEGEGEGYTGMYHISALVIASVPEPSTLLLLGIGLVGAAVAGARFRR
jgi:hypothetical protein